MYQKLNWKSILLSFAVLWLFAHSFKILGYLYNTELAEAVRAGTFEETARRFTTSELTTFTAFPFYAYNVGYFVGFLACFLLWGRKKVDIIEAIITLVVFMVISYFGWTGWNNYLKHIFLAPGYYLNGLGYFLVNGLIMLSIGLSLLFVKNRLSF